jgi:hypothetical protein
LKKDKPKLTQLQKTKQNILKTESRTIIKYCAYHPRTQVGGRFRRRWNKIINILEEDGIKLSLTRS